MLALIGLVVSFAPIIRRSAARSSQLSMAFGLPSSFDSVFQQFGKAADAPAAVTVTAVAAPVTTVAAPIATVEAPVVKQVILVDPTTPASGLSGLEFAAGVGLGVAPYALIPVLALSAVKGLIKPPKPLPVVIEPTTTAGAYTKSLKEGLNEGIRELFSDKTADTELTKKGIKLSAGGFAVAIALSAVLYATTSATEAAKVVTKKPAAPAAIVKVVAPVPVAPPKVDTPVVDKVVADKAASDKAIADKTAADKAAADKTASDKAAADKASVDKAAADKVASDKAAADKTASDKAVADKTASDKAVADKTASEKAAADKASADKIASEKAVADKTASDKAVADKTASDKAVADKTASEKAVADKTASDKAASDKAASDKAAADNAASDKAAADKAASDKAAADKKPVVLKSPEVKKAVVEVKDSTVEYYVPKVQTGMEAEKVDFQALKLLRVRQLLLIVFPFITGSCLHIMMYCFEKNDLFLNFFSSCTIFFNNRNQRSKLVLAYQQYQRIFLIALSIEDIRLNLEIYYRP